MEVYKSKYTLLDFFPEQGLMEWTWLPATKNMSEEECKQEFLNSCEIMRKVRPKKLLGDTRNLFFIISPELQAWIDKTIFPARLEVGLKDVAIVLAEQILVQMATEQAMEESEGRKFNTRYFNDKEEAKKWLLAL